ncbi:MAG: aromatic ring-hydroxylating oxygenase subunit alpha [Nocardioidaceae bacterium]
MFKQATVGQQASPPAPLDPAELSRSLLPFGSSRMLPRGAYLDAEVLQWERRHIFSGWICVGRSTDVRAPRSMAAVSAGETGILLTRDPDGELHAFENACRHRGHELLPCGGTATPRAIVCPYHSWTYNFDGTLRGAPGFRDADNFDKESLGLNPVPVREWHGWVFVDPSGADGDFESRVGKLEDIVAPYDAASLQTAESHTYEVAANWKVVIENYQECYHCSMIHPELCRVSPPESGENLEPDGDWVGGWMELRSDADTMSLDGRSSGLAMARLDEQEARTVMYVAVIPNLLISLHPDYIMSHVLMPLDADHTRITCSWAFPPEAMAREGFDAKYAVDFWDLTNRQDWSACESAQRGMHTPHFRPGPLAPAEDGVYQFVTYMARAYQGSPSE